MATPHRPLPGTRPDGRGAHRSDFLVVLVTDGGLATRLELYEIDGVEDAFARFAELTNALGGGPVRGSR